MFSKNPTSFGLALLLIAACLPFAAVAQRTAKVQGEYRYILGENDNVTIKQAKNKCIEMAQAEAIKKEFGSVVSSDVVSSEKETDEKSSSSFIHDTSTSARAEWLGDEKAPVVTMAVEGNDLVFTAHVWGTAREITKASTAVEWKVMRKDDTGRLVESDNFNSGERIFVNFTSPVDGYVVIFLIGEDETYAMLPYSKDKTGRFRVGRKNEYTFFDKKKDPGADALKLSTNQLQEHDQLVCLFSTNPIPQPNALTSGSSDGTKRPNKLDNEEFTKWLIKQQRADKEMVVAKKWLTVNGREE